MSVVCCYAPPKETLHHFLLQTSNIGTQKKQKRENEDKMEDVLLLHKFSINTELQNLSGSARKQWRSCWWVVGPGCQNWANEQKKEDENQAESFHMQHVSPGSDILFICVRMDTSPFLLLTANALQPGCFCSFSLWAKFPPLWLVEVFDTLLLSFFTAWYSVSSWTSLIHSFLLCSFWYFPENASFILTPYFSLTLDFPTKAWVAPAFFLWKLFLFCVYVLPFFPPSHCWPRIFPTSLAWTAPLFPQTG